MPVPHRRAVPLAVAALACVAAAVPAVATTAAQAAGKPAAKPPVTRIGVMANGVKKLPLRIKTTERLGVSLARPNAEPVGELTPSQSVFKHHFASLDLFLTIVNRTGKVKTSPPATDLAAYARAFGQTLDATTPKVVAVENEELAPKFYSGTPTQYLAQLEAAVKVAHARKVAITNGGIVAGGVVLATWHDFWKQGKRRLADDFMKLAMVALRAPNPQKLLNDMPTAAAPRKPIFAANPRFATLLQRTERYIAGFRRSRMDYVNFHWYQAGAKPLGQAIRFLEKATGKRAVTNEIGQFDLLPSTVTSILGEVRARHLPYAVWYGADGTASKGLYDKGTGALRPNGIAFRDYVRKHPS